MIDSKHHGHCCETMYYRLKTDDPMLFYDPSKRLFIPSMSVTPFTLKLKKHKTWTYYPLIFCPYCEQQFPADLVEKSKEVLKKEYGIDNPDDPMIQ